MSDPIEDEIRRTEQRIRRLGLALLIVAQVVLIACCVLRFLGMGE